MDVITSIDIARSPEEVFSWIADPDKAMQWQPGVTSRKMLKETPGKVGTMFTEVMEENGKRLEMQGEVTAYTPGKTISFRLASSIHTVQVTYAVSGDAKQSTLTVDSSINWKFPMNIIAMIMGRKIRSTILAQTMASLDSLKTLCEKNGDFSLSPWC